MLRLTLHQGDVITLGDTRFLVKRVGSSQVELVLDAPEHVRVARGRAHRDDDGRLQMAPKAVADG